MALSGSVTYSGAKAFMPPLSASTRLPAWAASPALQRWPSRLKPVAVVVARQAAEKLQRLGRKAGKSRSHEMSSLIIEVMPTTEETRLRLAEIPNLTVFTDTPLSRYTRFGIGGPADLYAETENAEAFVAALAAARASGIETHGDRRRHQSDCVRRRLPRHRAALSRRPAAGGQRVVCTRTRARYCRIWWISPSRAGWRGWRRSRASPARWGRRFTETPARTATRFQSVWSKVRFYRWRGGADLSTTQDASFTIGSPFSSGTKSGSFSPRNCGSMPATRGALRETADSHSEGPQ